jgi:hypothetical protein
MTWLTSRPSASAASAAAGEALGKLFVVRACGSDARRQGIDIGSFTEDGQSLLPARQQPGRSSGAAELPRAAENRFDALLDFAQAPWIQLDAVGVTTQGRDRFASSACADCSRRRLRERGVILGKPIEAIGHRRDLRLAGGITFGQYLQGELGAVDEARGMRQALVLLVQRAILRCEKPSVCSSRTCQSSCSRSAARPRCRCWPCQASPWPRASCARLPPLPPAGVEPGMRVEQRALRFAAHQRLMRVLAVDVDQRFGHLAQLLDGHRRTIQIGARTAVGIDHAPQQQATLGVRSCASSHRGCRRAVEVELGRDFRAFAAGANQAASARSPRAKASASTRIDLPAPVSPVSVPNPAETRVPVGRPERSRESSNDRACVSSSRMVMPP